MAAETATGGRRTMVPGAFRRPPTRRRTRKVFTRRQRWTFSLLNLAVFLVLWEVVAVTSDVPKLFLPSFTEVIGEIAEMSAEGLLWGNVSISLWVYVVGMVISMAIAIPMGMLIGGFPLLDRALSTYVWAMYTTPRLVLMPIILLWVGINDTARIVIIVSSAVPATLVVVMEGVRTVDNSLLTAARSFGASRSRLFRSVVMPATVPFIATGVRMGVSRGLLGLFIGEIFTANNGIGYIIALAAKTFNSARTYAMLLIFVLFCVAMVSLTQFLEGKVLEWRKQQS